MRDISTQLGDRLQHLQTYWDEQLTDSVSNVKLIRSKLSEGLGQVDDSLTRLREQEKMAQGFTRKLIEHHQEQAKSQQENTRLSSEVHHRLEEMLQESGHLLEQMKRYQQDADTVFQNFNTDMDGLESQAQQHFSSLFQTTDSARTELTAGLEESRGHLGNMRLREAQSDELSRRIGQQFEHLDHIRVERISKTLDLTEQMSSDLQKGAENARHLLSTLERAVRDVSSTLTDKAPEPGIRMAAATALAAEEADPDADPLDLILETKPSTDPVQPSETHAATETDSNPHSNLVSLRAYR
jgi:chromosome segregation ATPase